MVGRGWSCLLQYRTSKIERERERESERQSERERERERERESSHFGSSSKGGPGAGGIRPASGVLAPTPPLLQT